jgi:ABC-type nitrate/sulfonate/bicarbonate transport system permease component
VALGLANGLSLLSARLTDTTLQMVRNIPHLVEMGRSYGMSRWELLSRVELPGALGVIG